MRRRSLSPPRNGVTHSRYSPSCTRTVSPGWASRAAALIVRSGASAEPSALFDPVVATWYSVIGRAPLVWASWVVDERGMHRVGIRLAQASPLVAAKRQHTPVLGVGRHAE